MDYGWGGGGGWHSGVHIPYILTTNIPYPNFLPPISDIPDFLIHSYPQWITISLKLQEIWSMPNNWGTSIRHGPVPVILVVFFTLHHHWAMDTQLEQSTFSMSCCKLSEGLVAFVRTERRQTGILSTCIMKVYIYIRIVEVGVAININILSQQMHWIDYLIK